MSVSRSQGSRAAQEKPSVSKAVKVTQEDKKPEEAPPALEAAMQSADEIPTEDHLAAQNGKAEGPSASLKDTTKGDDVKAQNGKAAEPPVEGLGKPGSAVPADSKLGSKRSRSHSAGKSAASSPRSKASSRSRSVSKSSSRSRSRSKSSSLSSVFVSRSRWAQKAAYTCMG